MDMGIGYRNMSIKIKRIENMSLMKQLVLTILVALVICLVTMGIILPSILKPYYEMNVYEHLEQPAKYIEPGTNKMGEDIAFIIIMRSGAIYSSDNLEEKIPSLTAKEIIDLAKEEKGKFNSEGTNYYYLWGERKNSKNLILLSDSYIVEQEDRLLKIIVPTLVATIAITITLLFMWAQYILSKIKKLEKKTKAIITNDIVDGREFKIDDELNELNSTIEQVKIKIKQKDEYKNMMFQNLSHELKTPISVIQSYIEGVNDGVIEKNEAFKIIEEETNILSNQVKTILQINKIDYMKHSEKHKNSKVDITKVIISSIERHKLIRNDVECVLEVDDDLKDEEKMFRGTEDLWESVLDNILGNFIRYAKSSIVIKISRGEITLFNDGDKIKDNVIDKIFLPYVKGEKGQSGLGLSIVKKTVNLFGYDITANNLDNGVVFIIK